MPGFLPTRNLAAAKAPCGVTIAAGRSTRSSMVSPNMPEDDGVLTGIVTDAHSMIANFIAGTPRRLGLRDVHMIGDTHLLSDQLAELRAVPLGLSSL